MYYHYHTSDVDEFDELAQIIKLKLLKFKLKQKVPLYLLYEHCIE